MLRSFVTDTIKKITLEMIYKIVEERTEDLYNELQDIKEQLKKLNDKRENDHRYFSERIDKNTQDVRMDVAQLRVSTEQKFDEVHKEIAQLRESTEQKFDVFRESTEQKFDVFRESTEQKFNTFRDSIEQKFNDLRNEVKTEIRALNQRIDTIMTILINMNDKLNQLNNQLNR